MYLHYHGVPLGDLKLRLSQLWSHRCWRHITKASKSGLLRCSFSFTFHIRHRTACTKSFQLKCLSPGPQFISSTGQPVGLIFFSWVVQIHWLQVFNWFLSYSQNSPVHWLSLHRHAGQPIHICNILAFILYPGLCTISRPLFTFTCYRPIP